MLLIGTVISLITAVAATRAMLGLLAGFRWFDNPRFMGAQGQQTGEVAADRLHAPALHSGSRSPARSSLIAHRSRSPCRGLNLGIDFKGGTQVTFKTPQPHAARRRCATQTHAIGHGDAVVQGRGTAIERRQLQELPDPH